VSFLKGLLGTVSRQMKLAPDLDARFPRGIQRSVVRINLALMVFCFVLNTVFSESYPTPSGEVHSNQLPVLVFGLLLAVLVWTGSAPRGAE